jgi:MiaB-like tRNA modifying enzyme
LNIVSTGRILDIAKFASESLSGKRVYETGDSRDVKLCLPKIRDNPVIDIVPICSGCASACAFCATRIAKGSIFSYPAEKIISEISSARSFGTKEFWITGQDVSAYGMDDSEKSSLPNLIERITENITGKYFLRMGMMNPKNIKPASNELLRSFRSDKVFKFLHLPVQSGSDKMLKKMNRQHSAQDFMEIIEKFRRHYPRITIWTDIITGFPEESDEDFELSIRLIEEAKPDFTNISMFSSHHKTPAARMKQVSSEKKKERSSRLSEIARKISLEKNNNWIGWQGEVLVDEFKKDKQNYIGRNFAYKPVVLRSASKLALGSFANVKITEARQTCLIGEII